MNIKIYPSQVSGEISAPPSKSYTNRALILAALTHQPVTIHNPLDSDDTNAMIECLKTLGISIQKNDTSIDVIGSITDVQYDTYELNARLSGTTIRFLLPLLCIIPGIKKISGEEGLNNRPIGDLVDALCELGAKIEYLDKKGYPPLKVTSDSLHGKNIAISGKISSQFLSAILMITPIIGGLTIDIKDTLYSKPFVDMTIDIMHHFGITVVNKEYKQFQVESLKEYATEEYFVEGDYSSAAYFFAIAAITGSEITVKNLNPDSKQADKKFLEILQNMENTITFGKDEIRIQGNGVQPVHVDMEGCPDQAMTLAVLAAFTNGATTISGVQSLKIKETDRNKAVVQELHKMGIKTESTTSSLTIQGGNPHGAEIDTYGDHRIAMSFAVAGAKIEGVIIKNPEVVNKTFPDFWKKLSSIGIKTEEV